jgi:hypothetical protein
LIHTTSGTGNSTSGTSRGFRVKVLWKEDFPSINHVTNCFSLFRSMVLRVVGLPKTAKLRHLNFTIQSYILSTIQDALTQNYLASYMKLSNPLGSYIESTTGNNYVSETTLDIIFYRNGSFMIPSIISFF